MNNKFSTEELAILLDLVIVKNKEQLEKCDKVKNWLNETPLKTLENKLRKLLLGE